MIALAKLWKFGIGILIGLAIGWFVMVPIAREAARSASYDAGRNAGIGEERVLHEEQRRKAEAKADEDRRAAQAKINAIEADYHQRDQARRADMAELERALQDVENDATPIPTPSPGAPVCRPAVSRSVSDALNRLGRAAPRNDPPKPDPAVRGRR